jgi:excinuclease ABC subunit A
VRWRDRSIADSPRCRSRRRPASARSARGPRRRDRPRRAGRDALAARFLERVGLGYLALDRAAPTLSGGEAQRIRLAAQLGSNLQGVCYVLDEPTIGLHPRDNRDAARHARKLRDKGNTLVVVEHDEDTIRRAEHVIDSAPARACAAAGRRAGHVAD